MTSYATIWRADSPLARCKACAAQQQFHGRPNFSCAEFAAETAADIEPADLSPVDLAGEIARLGYPVGIGMTGWTATDADITRAEACRTELRSRIKSLMDLEWDDLCGSLAA